MKGVKTGGRGKGTPNRDHAELLARCQKAKGVDKDYNPVVAMAIIANDPSAPLGVRVECHDKVAKYTIPQVKSIELTGPEGGPLLVSWDE